MKKIILALVAQVALQSFASEKNVKSVVKSVTLFTQGAQVFRSAPVSISPGTTELVFSGLSSFLNASSIQAGGKGNFIVMEVKHNIRYPEPPKTTEGKLPPSVMREIKAVEDSLTESGFLSEELSEKKNALLLEKNMIQKNKLALGEGKSDSLNVLKQAMEFFRSKLNDINAQLHRIHRDEQRLLKDKDRLNARMADLQKYKNDNEPPKKYEPVHEIIVTVSTEEPATGTVEVSYLVSNAGWTPSYDLRSVSASAPVTLTSKANVFQSTGEDWNEVKLKLSTSNPGRSSTKPELPVWYLNYFYPRHKATTGASVPMLLEREMDESKKLMNKVDDLGNAETAANYSQLIETMTNVEYDVKLPFSIPSNGTVHVVPVKNSELKASYTHYLVPKLENEAFLVAQVTGWEELNMLPGKVNLFYEGTYVGHTVINPQIIQDTLLLSLGRDHGITVSRKKMPVTEKNKLLGSEVTRTFAYEIKMKNNKSGTVSLVVEDQVPLSQNKEIKIVTGNIKGADYNDKTGMLKWSFSLGARENKQLDFSYLVTCNKDMPLSVN